MSSHLQAWATSSETMLYLVNISATAAMACAAGLLAARVFRRWPVPLRYGLLQTSLVLTVLSAGLVYVAQQSGTGLFKVELLAALGIQADDAVVESASSTPHVAAEPDAPELDRLNEVTTAKADDPGSPVSRGGVAASLLLTAWATGVAAHLGRLAWGAIRVAQFRRTLVEPEEPGLLAAANRVAAALRLTRTPRLGLSPATPAPLVVGLWRPQIVLPEDLCQELTAEQLDAILLHETAHVAHRDQWARLVQRLIGTVFWPLPLIHMVNRRLSALREEICDNYVVRNCGTGRCLAEVLVVLAERVVGAVPRPAIVGLLEPVEGGLPGRIERLLQKERNTMTRMNFWTFSATALFGLAVGATALVMTVRAADKDNSGPRKVEELLGAEDFWSTTGVAVKHDFDEKQITEIRQLATQSPEPVIRIRASKLVCDLDGRGLKAASPVPAEMAAKVVGTAFTYLESNLMDATVSKFAPGAGFTHYHVTTRDKEDADHLWFLIEEVGKDKPSGGLNLRFDIKTNKVVKIEHWGVERAKSRSARLADTELRPTNHPPLRPSGFHMAPPAKPKKPGAS